MARAGDVKMVVPGAGAPGWYAQLQERVATADALIDMFIAERHVTHGRMTYQCECGNADAPVTAAYHGRLGGTGALKIHPIGHQNAVVADILVRKTASLGPVSRIGHVPHARPEYHRAATCSRGRNDGCSDA